MGGIYSNEKNNQKESYDIKRNESITNEWESDESDYEEFMTPAGAKVEKVWPIFKLNKM